jgi:hypothetical protein
MLTIKLTMVTWRLTVAPRRLTVAPGRLTVAPGRLTLAPGRLTMVLWVRLDVEMIVSYTAITKIYECNGLCHKFVLVLEDEQVT